MRQDNSIFYQKPSTDLTEIQWANRISISDSIHFLMTVALVLRLGVSKTVRHPESQLCL